MKVAIVHDWLTSFGGGECVVLKLHKLFPEAPIYTTVYNKKELNKYFKNIEIKTSFIQKLPFGVKKYRYFLPLMPRAFEEFDLNEYDIVISSSSCCAKGVNVNANTLHFCYCHTPMRYAWDMYNQYNNFKGIKKWIISKQMYKLRQWDYISSNRVDYFISNSHNVANRIKKHYRRDSEVIYPGINNKFFEKDLEKNKDGYYLVVSRLVKYKDIEIIIKTFNELNLPLVIVGGGPEEKELKRMAKENIQFAGFIDDEEIYNIYQKCKAFVYSAEEDFGMVMAEAQAMGKPVIAFNKGGACEIVKNDITGILFDEPKVENLKKAVLKLENEFEKFKPEQIRESARKFSEDEFYRKIKDYIISKYKEEKNEL